MHDTWMLIDSTIVNSIALFIVFNEMNFILFFQGIRWKYKKVSVAIRNDAVNMSGLWKDEKNDKNINYTLNFSARL